MKLLKERGWTVKKVRGSHYKLIKDGATQVVPNHGKKTLGRGLLDKILKKARIDPDEILRKDQKAKKR